MSAPFRIGSEEHKQAFCAMLTDTYRDYDPYNLAWPELDAEGIKRLHALPFWRQAVLAERSAATKIAAYADTIEDPVLRNAIALQGREEARHAVILENMIERYQVPLYETIDIQLPRHPETAFIRLGYGECLDSFFAFGMFQLAYQCHFFDPALIQVFEPIVQEEARHILFFVNWVAWVRAQRSFPRRIAYHFACIEGLFMQIRARIKIARDIKKAPMRDGKTTPIKSNFSIGGFLDLCLAENTRRMNFYDPRLIRPSFTPRLARLGRLLLPKSPLKSTQIQTDIAQSNAAD